MMGTVTVDNLRPRPPRNIAEAPITQRALYEVHLYNEHHDAPPTRLTMHTATLGALLAEWRMLDKVNTVTGHQLFGILIVVDDECTFGRILSSVA